jgi:hypothetical protein
MTSSVLLVIIITIVFGLLLLSFRLLLNAFDHLIPLSMKFLLKLMTQGEQFLSLGFGSRFAVYETNFPINL